MPMRPLGRTGENVSAIGLGGSRIGKVKDETESIRIMPQRTAQPAAEGKFELFKTATKFDSTAQHPQWLG